ncbi:hypothetical protein [Reyranella sp.]
MPRRPKLLPIWEPVQAAHDSIDSPRNSLTDRASTARAALPSRRTIV